MVISNKPLRFLVAILVAFLPLFSIANPIADSAKANIEATHKEEAAHQEAGHDGAHAEPTDVKTKVQAFIKHHVLDSHEFSFYQDDQTGANYGFPLPVILWDN